MNNQAIFKKTALAASIALLAACGGGSGTTTTDTSATTTGVITGFGSVLLGGTKYNTDNATKTVDGQERPLSDMSVGQKCTVVGTVDANGTTGTATSISCVDEAEGYVLSLNLDASGLGSINVMGQAVKVTLDTVFDSNVYTSISEVLVSDIVEVYGYSDGAGNITATRIETKDKNSVDTDIEVKGLVSSLDEEALTFMIGTLVVDYSAPSSVPALVDGLYVEVKAATMPDVTGVTPVLSATSVEIEDDGDMDIDGDSGQELNATGLVSNMVETGFTFNGSTFIDYASVDIEDTFIITDGMTITVEGYIDADGVFIPEEVVEEPESEAETHGYVTAVAEGTVSISMDNGDTVETFTVNNDTRMIDELTHDQYFNLTDVTDGAYVEIEYYTDDSGAMIATEVELEDAPSMTVEAPAPQ